MPGYASGLSTRSVKPLAHAFLGSNPSPGTIADVAQLVEHLHGKEGVTGSIPVVGSTSKWTRPYVQSKALVGQTSLDWLLVLSFLLFPKPLTSLERFGGPIEGKAHS